MVWWLSPTRGLPMSARWPGRRQGRLRRSSHLLLEPLERRELLAGVGSMGNRPGTIPIEVSRAGSEHLAIRGAKKPRLTVQIDTAATDLDHNGVLNESAVILTGRTSPRTKVKLDRGADGTFEQQTKSDKKGAFHFTVNVSVGTTPILVQVAKGGRKAPSRTLLATRVATEMPPTLTPPLAPSAPDLYASSDSGISDTDDITNSSVL